MTAPLSRPRRVGLASSEATPAEAHRASPESATREVRRHPREADRIASLHSYQVLDTAPAAAFDALTRLAAAVCGTPMAMISLIDSDRQWNLSRHGVDVAEVPRSESVCSDGVAAGTSLVVSDLTRTARYAGLPAVAATGGVRAYAGMPITGRDGLPLGMLCAVDTAPRSFSPEQIAGLADLAEQVVTVLELRRRDNSHGLTSATVVPDARYPGRLRTALDRGEFVPYFQPLIDMRAGTITGVETLVRWHHPSRGILSPAAFLPGLETGLLSQWTGQQMLEAGCRLMVDLRGRGINLPDGIAFNMSSDQLLRPGVASRILDTLTRYELPGEVLTSEITETAEISDPAVARRELWALREAGVRIVADDFGVGWSNLVRLLQFPLTGLKIDRELVTSMIGDPIRDHMVAAAITLAATMNFGVTAEGVETEAVRDRLLQLGCHQGQGWLYSKAIPAAELTTLLANQQAKASWVPQARPAAASRRTSSVGCSVTSHPLERRDQLYLR